MRFAIIGNAASTIVNFRAPLIREIAARNHQVFALAPDYDDAARAYVATLGAIPVDYPSVRTGMNPLRDWTDSRRLTAILRLLAPDIALCFGIKPATYGILAARRAKVPALYALITGLGYAFTEGGQQSFKRRFIGYSARFLYRVALRHVRRVFMQNLDDAADFLRLGIIPQCKVVTTNGTGVPLDEWPPAKPVVAPITFLLAARMIRDKGITEFIEAARMVHITHPATRFILIGGTDSNPEAIAESQIAAWVAEGLVEWHGHVDMRTWLAQTSVFVLPSYREGVPRSTQEALATGRPVITTDAPGCRETVIDGDNGFLVPPRNPGALVRAMLTFVENPHLIETMGVRSRRLAEERFDVRVVNRMMIEAMGL